VVVSRHVLVSTLWLLYCLPLACGRRRSLREDELLIGCSCVYFCRGCTLLMMLWIGLICVPEGSVGWDIQVIIAEKVGIMRNDMDDRRRVVRWGPWQRTTLH
jgi:hypothetical protein